PAAEGSDGVQETVRPLRPTGGILRGPPPRTVVPPDRAAPRVRLFLRLRPLGLNLRLELLDRRKQSARPRLLDQRLRVVAGHRGDERTVARSPVFRVLGPRRSPFHVSAVHDFPDLARDEPYRPDRLGCQRGPRGSAP